MFEMFFTVVAALIAALYGLSQSVFMNGPHRNLYRIAFLVLVLLIYLIYRVHHKVKCRHIREMGVDEEDYFYYDKYTSPLYRIAYYISYLVQNIFFDYMYMQRNFNFCKGLDAYDGGVSEYYIQFRSTWYQYLRLTNIRHKISIQKLLIYSCNMKNQMILEALEHEEDREFYHAFEAAADALFKEQGHVKRRDLKTLPHYADLPSLFLKNVYKKEHALEVIAKRQPSLKKIVERQNYRKGRDVTEFKKTDYR